MATDNTTLNPGTGGDAMRSLADAAGAKWAAAVATYATTVSPGANVLQIVTPATPMPSQISDGTHTAGVTAAGALKVDQSGSLSSQQAGALAGTPLYAKIAASASGATPIVAAVAGKSIVVLRWSVSANGAVNVNLQSHATTGTATGLHYLTQFASAGGAYCPAGIFATVAGEALDINLSGAVAVGGELTYILI
jgi:hypothetical protein